MTLFDCRVGIVAFAIGILRLPAESCTNGERGFIPSVQLGAEQKL
jgi:hypothetical protein